MKDFCTKALENKWLSIWILVASLMFILLSNYLTTYVLIQEEGINNNIVDIFPRWKWIMHMTIIVVDSFLLGKLISFKKVSEKDKEEVE